MKVFFRLYQRYARIAAAEALTVTQGRKIAQFEDEILLAEIKSSAFSRLGLSHAAYEFLFTCTAGQLWKRIGTFSWRAKRTFKVVAHHADNAFQKAIARRVAQRLSKRKADLRHPGSEFHFFFIDGNVVVGKLLWQSTEDFEARKVHRWPAPHPTGTHPQLARAMVNLTGITKGELVDPFCGAGGTLIEAGLIGLKAIGSDIEPKLLAKAVKNLQGYGIKSFKLAKKDARTLSGKIPYLVADLPYGRNTPRKGLEELYAAFLARLKTVLTKRAVLGFPDTIDHKPLIKKAGLKIIGEFDWYINRHLRKKIVIVQNPPRR